MATAGGRTGPSLRERLRAEPYRYGFFPAVWLLQALAPDRERVGGDGPPAAEAVRFRSEQSLEFPASEILDVTGEDGDRAEMVVRFMGLTGPQGALPRVYSELVIERLRRRDPTLAAFLDLFNHRLVSLFFRAWEKSRPRLLVDRDGRDDLSRWLFSLFGMGTRGLRGRLAVRDTGLLLYTGLLALKPRSSTGLETLLADYFHDVPVRVVQFVGQWLPLEPEAQTCLRPFGGNTRLGVDALVGSRVWHTQSRFRVVLGPTTYARFCELLPCGASSPELLELTRFFVGLEFDFEFQLVLRAEEVPPSRLGAPGPQAPRLGWSTWLVSQRAQRDAHDLVLDGERMKAYHEATTEEAA
jgi:type VI secretion system protein ImpH